MYTHRYLCSLRTQKILTQPVNNFIRQRDKSDILVALLVYSKKTTMKSLHGISFVLLVIGGLNWLLVGFGWNLVDAIFGAGSTGSKIIYIIVGLAALYLLFSHKKTCRMCDKVGA
jgi:uncharacterized membrane protein YuzA (DUF378 family)